MKKHKLNMKKVFRTLDLFAGVGGFRLGLEGLNNKSASSGYKKSLKSQSDVL